MLEDYQSAKKLGEAAAKAAIKEGKSPYLPVLDAIPEIKDSVGEAYIGVLELPVSYIVGNKEMSRNNAFACNFMPLMNENSEFAMKWSVVYKHQMTDGVSDAKFETDANLHNPAKWWDLWRELPHRGPEEDGEAARKNLLEWLNFWSPGNHDDRTLAFLY